MEIHQIVPSLLYGDAIGNHVLSINKLLRESGIKSSVYADVVDERYSGLAMRTSDYVDREGSILIYHYAIASDITKFVRSLRRTKVVLYYHNITPHSFFSGIDSATESSLRQGRIDLRLFLDSPVALSVSEYNKLELKSMGFSEVIVVPYLVNFDRFARVKPASSFRSMRDLASCLKVIFVGRVAPNKCHQDLLKTIYAYKTLIDEKVCLLIVGNIFTFRRYTSAVLSLVEELNLWDNVELLGHVEDAELAWLYHSSDVFLSMSEHEGFCVPILEAMHFGKPVVAFSAAGVPYTMGSAGILLHEKRFDVAAQVLAEIQAEEEIRRSLVAAQYRRLAEFDPAKVSRQLLDVLLRLEEYF